MRVTLLLGFLGAGKTTLLQSILKSGVGGERVAVIVNEFGAVGVDGEILAGRALDTIELASGCICCALKGEMVDAIAELAESVEPEHLIIEASGVAQPDDVIAALREPSLAAKIDIAPVITIVDAARFDRMISALGPFYASQVARADVVVVNKIDEATAEQVEDAVSRIASVNPRATIELTEYCDLDPESLLGGTSQYQADSFEIPVQNHDHINMKSCVLEMRSGRNEDEFFALFEDLPSEIWRAKGFVRLDGRSRLVQYVSGSLETRTVPDRERHYLVFIGSDLDRDTLRERFSPSGGH